MFYLMWLYVWVLIISYWVCYFQVKGFVYKVQFNSIRSFSSFWQWSRWVCVRTRLIYFHFTFYYILLFSFIFFYFTFYYLLLFSLMPPPIVIHILSIGEGCGVMVLEVSWILLNVTQCSVFQFFIQLFDRVSFAIRFNSLFLI